MRLLHVYITGNDIRMFIPWYTRVYIMQESDHRLRVQILRLARHFVPLRRKECPSIVSVRLQNTNWLCQTTLCDPCDSVKFPPRHPPTTKAPCFIFILVRVYRNVLKRWHIEDDVVCIAGWDGQQQPTAANSDHTFGIHWPILYAVSSS